MIRVSIPYKSHPNKHIWDYMSYLCSQINNINLASSLDSPEAQFDNVIYVILDKFSSENTYIKLLVSLSNKIQDNQYSSYCDIWGKLSDLDIDDNNLSVGTYIFSFDIKKYNSVLSFSESYQDRDKINFYIDENTNKLYYKISNNNFVDLSPIVISDETKSYIESSCHNALGDCDRCLLSVDSVDKNSFLLPFMSYKDFLNFAVFSADNVSVLKSDTYNNYLVDNNNCIFNLKVKLRSDKFSIDLGDNDFVFVPNSLWQVLVILQHFKFWRNFKVMTDINNFGSIGYLDLAENATVAHYFKRATINTQCEDENFKSDLLYRFKLVGKLHSNELFKLNKLYSNANRTCFFDFSTQTFTGNNYVFNDDKLEIKTVDLENKVEAELPLKMTFTEIKHYIGSDLSQKNFYLYVYTDGVRVMLERWNDDNMDCRVIFNHVMSKKNQNLPL